MERRDESYPEGPHLTAVKGAVLRELLGAGI